VTLILLRVADLTAALLDGLFAHPAGCRQPDKAQNHSILESAWPYVLGFAGCSERLSSKAAGSAATEEVQTKLRLTRSPL
jgi:hypothetical protein